MFVVYGETMVGESNEAQRQLRDFQSSDAWAGTPMLFMPLLSGLAAMVGDTESARAIVESSPSAVPSAVAQSDRTRLLLLMLAGDTVGSLTELRRIDEVEPCGTRHCYELMRAPVYIANGRYDEAVASLENIISRGGNFYPLIGLDDLAGRIQLGPVLEAAGDTAKAITA
ncbi:MAG: hypothetical protein L7S64_10985 [Longimicrobiales bacterium]|nr:hypothetical protein [Longimicrobiales bacterium]